MKNLLVLFVFVSLVSCKGVEQYKGAIEELSGKWDAATTAVTDLSKMVMGEEASMTDMLAGMALDPEVLAKLKPEDQEKITSSQATCVQAGAGYKNLSSEIASFVSEWTTKGEMLTTLKDGLAAGKIEGDVTSQIADLTTSATDAMAKVEGWKSAFETVKKGCDDNMASYKTLLESFMPASK